MDLVNDLKVIAPDLEVLIAYVRYFMYRPQRSDYPADDGLDEVERQTALKIFERYPSLRMLSLTGLPDAEAEQESVNRRGRIWIREEGGVRIVGAADLPEYTLR